MKVLLIGGTGVLSAAVANEAVKQGIDVSMVNRGRRPLPDGVQLLKSDKDDYDNIAQLIGGNHYDAVIDFLCFTDAQVTRSFSFYKQYTQQYFFISSCAVYDTRIEGVKTEDSPKVLSIWKYSVDKWASEEHLYAMAAESGIYYTVVRPGVTYDDTRIPYGIMPPYGFHWTLVERIKHGKPVIRWNMGENRSSMMRVEDFAVGLVGLIGNPEAFNEALDPRIKELFLAKIEELKSLWYTVDYVDFPLLKYVWAMYYMLISAEVTSNLGRFDGIRFGLQEDMKWIKDLHEYYTKIRMEWFWNEVKKRILLGNYVVTKENYEKYYLRGYKARKVLQSEFTKFFKNYHAIVTPTTPTVASKFWEKANNSLLMYLEDLYTTPANLAWLPAISIPMWKVEDRWDSLPVGIQLTWWKWQEWLLLSVAEKIEMK